MSSVIFSELKERFNRTVHRFRDSRHENVVWFFAIDAATVLGYDQPEKSERIADAVMLSQFCPSPSSIPDTCDPRTVLIDDTGVLLLVQHANVPLYVEKEFKNWLQTDTIEHEYIGEILEEGRRDQQQQQQQQEPSLFQSEGNDEERTGSSCCCHCTAKAITDTNYEHEKTERMRIENQFRIDKMKMFYDFQLKTSMFSARGDQN